VYAAGVLLYELLTGVRPHEGETPIAVAYKHVHHDVPPPSERVPDLPTYVDALVARATARDRTRRPADAGVLLRQVRRVRSALEAGVVDDPELVADLTPHQARLDPFVDTDGQMPRQIIDPSEDTASWSPVEDTGEPVPSEAYAFPQVNNNPADDFPSGDYAPYSATPASPDDVFDQESEQTANLASVGVVPGIAPRQLPPDEQVYAEPEYEDEPDYDDADFGDETPRQRRRPGAAIAGFFRGNGRIRRPWLLPALLVLALVIGLGGWYFGVARYTTTPGVINLSQSDAQAKVRKAGLTFKVKGQGYSETIPAGAVLRTDPQAGSRILKSGSVSAVISRGPERHAVPDVGGLTLDQAQQMLIQSGLTFGKAVESFSRSVPAGKVVRTDPVVKTELRRGAPVDVVVSKGRRPINVPNYTGKPGTDAKKALAKLKFKVTTTQSYSDTVPLGLVIKQTPQGGTLFKGDNVTINISLGPRLYAVPGTVGMGIAAATQTLQAAGFQVATVNSPSYIGLNYVLTQDPVEGTKVPKGTIITLSLV
ncbi:MAG: hypothetical protein JWO46_2387, partial [Nocardioidaceae bacterium]|nr:hypothetical protein [Nocardioidaceae bacterium]